MFNHIMVPVDLAHQDIITKAIEVAAGLAKQFGAKVTLVGVTGTSPSAAASSPEDYKDKLAAYADAQSASHGAQFGSHAKVSVDVAVELDDKLEEAAKELNADLVVMASHVPGFADLLHGSKAGYLASHARISVFVVR